MDRVEFPEDLGTADTLIQEGARVPQHHEVQPAAWDLEGFYEQILGKKGIRHVSLGPDHERAIMAATVRIYLESLEANKSLK